MDITTIDFAMALTGHDRLTIEQMYRDWEPHQLQAAISRQAETEVRQLVAFVKFLCQYHTEAKEIRNIIALSTSLKEAQELAMFEYPIVQGSVFNWDIQKIGTLKFKTEEGDIQKAIEYLTELSNQSA